MNPGDQDKGGGNVRRVGRGRRWTWVSCPHCGMSHGRTRWVFPWQRWDCPRCHAVLATGRGFFVAFLFIPLTLFGADLLAYFLFSMAV